MYPSLFTCVRDGVIELLSGLSKHLFDKVDERKNFYGNYEIEYET
jgi:hypothetical protein